MIIGMPTPIAELSFQGLLSLCLNQTQENFQLTQASGRQYVVLILSSS